MSEPDAPPPREPWEQPPSDGWGSSMRGLGLELASFVLSAAAAAAAVRLAIVAHHLGAARHHPWAVPVWLVSIALGLFLLVWLARRLRGLGLLHAMLTDYGRAARLRGRPPVFLDAAPPAGVTLAHLSDLHVAEGDRVRLVERALPAGNARARLLLASPALDGAWLVVTGDVTDRGTAASWRCVHDELRDSGRADHTVLVPGNHDLQLLDPIDSLRGNVPAWRRDRFALVHLGNLFKFAEAFADTGGGARGVVAGARGPLPYRQAWEAAEREVRPLLEALPSAPVPPLTVRHFVAQRPAFVEYVRRIETARAHLQALFPVAVPLGDDAVLFVLNSSSLVSRHPATNALGMIGREQYRRLRQIAASRSERVALVALHHHVVRRGEELGAGLRARLMAKFTVLGDPGPLLRFCAKRGVRAVLHGHRHLSYQLRLPGGTVLLAAPSSTLGDELAGDPRPQLERYQIAPRAEGISVGIFRQVVRPIAAPPVATVEAATSRLS